MDNILIVGSESTFVKALYKKLTREGHRVSILSNRKNKTLLKKPHYYYYDYADDSVREVLASSRPGTILFTGVYDGNYSWTRETERADYRSYIAGLGNLLACAQDASVKRFVYLSSECVFEDNYLVPLVETALTSPNSVRSIAVSMGESMVSYFSEHFSMDMIIARIDHLYYCPANAEECRDSFTKMCLQAVTEGQITVNTKILRSGIYLNDAVEAVFLLITCISHNRTLYHITSGEEISEAQAAGLIAGVCSHKLAVVDKTMGTKCCIRLADTGFNREFQFQPLHSLNKCLPRIMQYIQNHRKRFGTSTGHGENDKARFTAILHKLFPFLESFVCFLIVLWCEWMFQSNRYFEKVDFFLLYVLLFAIIHGTYQSVFAATLSMLGYLYVQSGTVLKPDLLMDVGTYVWIAQIFIIGMSVGYLRDRLLQLQKDREEEMAYLSERLSDVTEIAASTTEIKNYFEQQVINSQDGFGTFFDIVDQIDSANENEVLFVSVQILEKVMGTKDVAIYRVVGNGYCRLVASTSNRSYELGKSIKTSEYLEIFDTLNRKHIYINKSIDEKLPGMASGMEDENGQLQIVIFLWDIPYEKMTLQGSNTLRILSLLIQNAVTRSTAYLEALAHRHYHGNTSIMEKSAFYALYKIYQNAEQKNLTVFSLLRLKSPMQEVEQTAKLISPLLRNTDLVGYMGKNIYYALLPNSQMQDIGPVLKRLQDAGFDAEYTTGIWEADYVP